MAKLKSRSDVISFIQSGNRVFVHGAAATPNALLRELESQASRLKNVELIHLHTEGPAFYAKKEMAASFRVMNLFVGPNIRPMVDYERIDYVPCFLSEIPRLFRSGRRPLDVALLHLSLPDKNGFCSLGVSVDVAVAAFQSAKLVLAQVNPRMPRVHGDGFIHIDKVHAYVEVDEALPSKPRSKLSELEIQIGRHAASLIDDGATLQVGIGSIPDAVLSQLRFHKNLGVHSEMWSDGMLDLIKNGAVDNSRKKVHRGKTVSGFINGSQELYDFIHDNPSVVQLEMDYVNNPAIIARNPKVVAINSAVEVDLTGQICADSIGPRIISGVGGQMDFMRGASLSEGGKPIIAISSRTSKGVPRIVPMLKEGAGVVTTRAHIQYVVTEYGIADLYGKSLSERAVALTAIAHPDDRSHLEQAWCKRGKS